MAGTLENSGIEKGSLTRTSLYLELSPRIELSSEDYKSTASPLMLRERYHLVR